MASCHVVSLYFCSALLYFVLSWGGIRRAHRTFKSPGTGSLTPKAGKYFPEKENAFLKDRLAKYEHPKNSRNSSVPPSKDENRPKKNQSLRKPTGRKPGGQKGREGKTLEMKTNPDVIVELQPDYCTTCGTSLQEMSPIKSNSRQVVDIPPLKAVYIEYQTFSKTCNCGCQTTAAFP